MTILGPDKTLKALEEKCRLLENQCSEYVNALKQIKRNNTINALK